MLAGAVLSLFGTTLDALAQEQKASGRLRKKGTLHGTSLGISVDFIAAPLPIEANPLDTPPRRFPLDSAAQARELPQSTPPASPKHADSD